MKIIRALTLFLLTLTPLFSQETEPPVKEEWNKMTEKIVNRQQIKNKKIIDAFNSVDRNDFVPAYLKNYAYADSSLPTEGGRIPSPSEIAMVLKNISFIENAKVLIIGNNAGYSAALFSKIFKQVFLIETSRSQSDIYKNIFTFKGYNNVSVYYGNNYDFFSVSGPFDIIFIQGGITALTDLFIDQLKPKGELFAPIQDQEGFQQLLKYETSEGDITISSIGNTFFRILY